MHAPAQLGRKTIPQRLKHLDPVREVKSADYLRFVWAPALLVALGGRGKKRRDLNGVNEQVLADVVERSAVTSKE